MCANDYLTAIVLFEKAMATQQMLLYDAHETLLGTMDHLAAANLFHGNKEKSINMLVRMLRAQLFIFGQEDTRCENTRNKIKMVRLKAATAAPAANLHHKEKEKDSGGVSFEDKNDNDRDGEEKYISSKKENSKSPTAENIDAARYDKEDKQVEEMLKKGEVESSSKAIIQQGESKNEEQKPTQSPKKESAMPASKKAQQQLSKHPKKSWKRFGSSLRKPSKK
mmetsp:Transcript_35834/g.39608  ORF Transcript_35834/g.39608 Transcript_35834/m.39608 type:complete len:223 (+) Transcript_35834:1-669(+)